MLFLNNSVKNIIWCIYKSAGPQIRPLTTDGEFDAKLSTTEPEVKVDGT